MANTTKIMSELCEGCHLAVTKETQTLSCGRCKKCFHQKCSKVTTTAMKEFLKYKSVLWLCSSCVDIEEPFQQKTSCCSEDNIITAIKEMFAKKIENIEYTCATIDKKVEVHIESTSTALKSTSEAVTVVRDDVAELKHKIAVNEEIIENLSAAVVNLQRNARLTNLVLDGLPENDDTKDLRSTILSISKILNFKLESRDIENCFRIRSGKSKVGSVLIRFARKHVRDGFFFAYLKFGNLKLSDILKNLNIHSRLYLNEHLSPYAKYLLGHGIKLRNQKIIHNCYSRNGNVYIQKTINDSILLLNKSILVEMGVVTTEINRNSL